MNHRLSPHPFAFSLLMVLLLHAGSASWAQQGSPVTYGQTTEAEPAALAELDRLSAGLPERQQTVITSESVEMIAGEHENRFYFKGSVKIQGTNLVATCEEMTVLALRATSQQTDPAASAQMGSIESITMQGSVVIEQAGRRATAGHAVLLPMQGTVTLTQTPVVTDGQGTVTGWKMVLHKGQRRVEILSDPSRAGTTEGRARITLPAVGDLGFVPEG
jgi:lipopolysaccharide export system protein LptA